MRSPVSQSFIGSSRYYGEQAARVAFYALYERAMRQSARPHMKKGAQAPRPSSPVPSETQLFQGIARLFAKDLEDARRGYFRINRGPYSNARELISAGNAFLKDVPMVARRRAQGEHQEVSKSNTHLPRYYRQNFHYQTDGWFSDESARIYDFQVEVLFKGTTAAMRRQGLVVLSNILKDIDQRQCNYVDLACGTGGLLHPALESFPRLKGIGLDLSLPYLHLAQKRLDNRRALYVNANAEQLPFEDNSLDVISCVYLFHELPPKVRALVASEIARCLKPDGHLIFVDSLQTGDTPDYDGLLELFPSLFHEPYYASYLACDLKTLFADSGLEEVSVEPAFFSRIGHYRKAKNSSS
ncbi:class I SAM-dependent methyltransferase [Rhodobacteraceae bacterium RKSG542]|uniref:class I SAM-dependent methyltransferase n=1 Tax=Pseudovibrio flavus TaxID=2529854 RepID=UPI0012BD8212|nr:class I SAM-dependent methyltransferase [Pseudovibrio flavus]MTI18732.1 class I SAM-dependent methyltransferase [Pseudovibrio flavus]